MRRDVDVCTGDCFRLVHHIDKMEYWDCRSQIHTSSRFKIIEASISKMRYSYSFYFRSICSNAKKQNTRINLNIDSPSFDKTKLISIHSKMLGIDIP